MEKDFNCPHCGGYLNVADHIVFMVQKENNKEAGLILLSPKIGNYASNKHSQFTLVQGEIVEFFCPICNKSLASDIDENLVQVKMKEGGGKEYDIYFSRIAGEQSTYQVSDDEFFESGKDAGRYTYFKLSNKYKPLVRFRKRQKK
jgi:transcription elongation factor Elf1